MPRGISKTPKKSSKLKKENAGRPTKMTPECIRKLEEVFGIGGSDGEACFYAEISTNTLYEYIKVNPSFHDRKEQLKERPILKARQELIKGLQNNPELALKYLERKRKAEFSLKTETVIQGDKDNPLEVKVKVINWKL
jgi:hypothetical protein